MKSRIAIAVALLAGGCSVRDGQVARQAKTSLVGMSAVELQACLGAPDQRSDFGRTKVFTYYATSTGGGGINVTLPIIGGGVSVSGSGYCHATFRLDDDRVTRVRYSGETDATFASDAFCAPIVRECMANPEPRTPKLGWIGTSSVTPEAPGAGTGPAR